MSKKVVKTKGGKSLSGKAVAFGDVVQIVSGIVAIAKDERQTANYLKKVDAAKDMIRSVASEGQTQADKIVQLIKDNKDLLDRDTIQDLMRTASAAMLKSTPSMHISLEGQIAKDVQVPISGENENVIDAEFEEIK